MVQNPQIKGLKQAENKIQTIKANTGGDMLLKIGASQLFLSYCIYPHNLLLKKAPKLLNGRVYI